jgi:TPR repeat protein
MMVIVVIAACRGNAPDRVAPSVQRSSAQRPPMSPLEQARALERGDGVPRDYRAAADIYRAACADGRGDPAACDALIRAHLFARGATEDREAAFDLARKACLAKRDPFCCGVAALSTGREDDLPEPLRSTSLEVLRTMAPCDRSHMSECHAVMFLGGLDFGGGTAASDRHSQRALLLCRVEIAEACRDLRNYGDEANMAEITRLMQAACDAHDADACAVAPDRQPIAPRELCTANDYEACAELGCAGDAAAGQLAASHGVDATGCGRFVPNGGQHHGRW